MKVGYETEDIFLPQWIVEYRWLVKYPQLYLLLTLPTFL
jgi:hypothetical protein